MAYLGTWRSAQAKYAGWPFVKGKSFAMPWTIIGELFKPQEEVDLELGLTPGAPIPEVPAIPEPTDKGPSSDAILGIGLGVIVLGGLGYWFYNKRKKRVS